MGAAPVVEATIYQILRTTDAQDKAGAFADLDKA
jgi:hypothetical protein